MAAARGGNRFQRSDRLLHSKDFQWVTRHGQRAASEHFIVLADPRRRQDEQTVDRLGITVSRKVGGAVVRNRLKRLIREWFRTRQSQGGEGVDLLVIARPAAVALQPSALGSELERLARCAARKPRR